MLTIIDAGNSRCGTAGVLRRLLAAFGLRAPPCWVQSLRGHGQGPAGDPHQPSQNALNIFSVPRSSGVRRETAQCGPLLIVHRSNLTLRGNYNTAHRETVCGPRGENVERHELGESCPHVLLGFIGRHANGVYCTDGVIHWT